MISRRYIYCLMAIIAVVCSVFSYHIYYYIASTQSKVQYLEQKISEYTRDTSNLEEVITQEQQKLVTMAKC